MSREDRWQRDTKTDRDGRTPRRGWFNRSSEETDPEVDEIRSSIRKDIQKDVRQILEDDDQKGKMGKNSAASGQTVEFSSMRTSSELQKQRDERRRKRDEERRNREVLRQTNREIIMCTRLFVLIFLGVILYMGYFMHHQADSYVNNSYNSRRQSLLENQCLRGRILASDGSVLAETIIDDDDDSEYRSYPYGRMFAHVVGYSNVGAAGLESQVGSYLLESHEFILNQILRNLKGEKVVGDTVQTTLNVELQEAAYEALGDYKGAVVVMNAKTGEILAEVSKPDYNPNSLPEYYEDLIESDEDNGTLVNRASQGLYTPGSTFKVMTLLEYMREFPKAWKNFTFDCDGIYSSDDINIQCYGQTEHGEEDITKAFAKSCNGAFAEIGKKLNTSEFYKTCTSFGFNQTISGVSMAASVYKLKDSNSSFKTMQTAIGQGETLITPLLNCMIAASVANKGVMMKPYLVASVQNAEGDTVKTFSPTEFKTVMTKKEANNLQDMMGAVVSEGTGSSAAGSGYTAYGKTGSAEVTKTKETDAWFIGYAVSENGKQKIAVSVVVEGGGAGGSVAAPIAGKIFRTYFQE